MMRKILLVAACAATLHLAQADELSGPGRKTLVNEPWGTVYCEESCTTRSDQFGKRHYVTSDKGNISLSQTVDGWLVQAPNQNLRLRRQLNLDGGERLMVTFNAATYVFETKANDYSWIFPGDRVFFGLREGELRSALGNEGAYKMHKKAGGVAYEIASEAGESQVLLGRKKYTKFPGSHYVIVRQQGEDLARHPYLVHGVVFDNGPIGMFIKMPRNPVLDALDFSFVKSVASKVPYPEAKVVETPVKERDPLQATEAPANEDPLGLKRNEGPKRDMKNPAPPDTKENNQWNVVPK
ncbi:MAG: hypothetical protein KF760_27835 [Candidatus Eremiobacteraeota bacterium]|nr:hypothetical protein [Candidatus Eremiobacteraeota bacterium]MCW5869188.1 hypothetical protein [Candidatus Eremiobacteraeota bacterium]